MTRQRAVVTGGAGFLGSHLCERLLGEGLEVVCLDNFVTGTAANVEHLVGIGPFRLVRADVTDYVHVTGPVDFVLHFASPASPIDYLQLPIETMKVGSIGTLHALGLAKEKGARFLLASTSEVYGDPKVHPQPESYWGHVNPVGPRGVYDEAKRFGEALTVAYRTTHHVDTAIVRIFNSVLADEQVLYDDGHELRRETVGALAARVGHNVALSGYTVPAFDEAGVMSGSEATWLVGHPTDQQCFEVRTRYGRAIRVTGDHSLFVRRQDGRPTARPVTELAIGDAVAIAGRVDLPPRDRDRTSMLDVVDLKRDPWRVAVGGPGFGDVLREHRFDLLSALMRRRSGSRQSLWGNVSRWVQAGEAPLAALRAAGISLPDDGYIRTSGGGPRPRIPLTINITDELLWVLGLFVAEGSWTRSEPKSAYISISCDPETLGRAEKILRRDIGVHVTYSPPSVHRAPSFKVNGQLFLDLLEHLGFLANKRVPGWVLGLPLHRLKWFLEGYREGDGVHSGAKLEAGVRHEWSTVSDALKDDLVVALGRFGVVPSVGRYETTLKQRTADRRYPFWRITVCNVTPWSILEWDRGVSQRLNAVRTGDLVWAQITDIRPIESTPLVYDFVVPGRENFWAGSGVMAHNTHGPRMRPHDGRAIPTFIRQALTGEPITVAGDGSQTRSIQYVDDLVEGVYRLLCSDQSGPMNIGNPHEVSMLDLAECIKSLTGSSSEIAFIPRPEDDPTIRQPNITLAQQTLGWEPKVALDDGLTKTIEWFATHPDVLTGRL